MKFSKRFQYIFIDSNICIILYLFNLDTERIKLLIGFNAMKA